MDPVLERQVAAGRTALALEQPEQAAKQFRDALTRSRERDDPAAIGDIGFNLSVAELQSGRPAAALSTARETEAELARRGIAPPAALQLAEAAALYRSGRPAEAAATTARVEAAGDPDAAGRAAFLRGLIADEAGQVADLRAALPRVAVAKGPEHRADEMELKARLALRNSEPHLARTAAEQAAAMRRDQLDYRGLARCLAIAARAAEQMSDPAAAADLYLRAGRTAAVHGDGALAKDWLNRAVLLSRDPLLTAAAHASIDAINARH